MRSLTFLLLTVSLFLACEPEEVSTIISTEERSFSEFNELNLKDLGDVEIIISNEYKLEITTHVDVLDDIKTYVRDGELNIELRGRHKNIKVLDYKIYVPHLNRIVLDGVGNVHCHDLLEANNLHIYQNGVGNIDLRNIKATTIYAQLEDVGDIILAGQAEQVAFRLDGVGSIEAFGLHAMIGEAILDGVGNIEINVSDDLTIRNDGVGKVFYIGNPDLHISGKASGVVNKN